MNGLFLSPNSASPPQLGSTLSLDGLELPRPTFRERSPELGLLSQVLESLAASTLIRKANFNMQGTLTSHPPHPLR